MTEEYRLFCGGVANMDWLDQQRARGGIMLLPPMPRWSPSLPLLTRSLILVFAVWLGSCGNVHAQRSGGVFERLVGHWAGGGTIDLSDGTREPIRCRAAYNTVADRYNLQLNIRCASDSYNFNLFSNAVLAGHAVSGTWSESTHGVGGTISGAAEDDRIQVRADSIGFAATLSLVTHSERQSVLIRTADPNSGIKGATMSLRRRR